MVHPDDYEADKKSEGTYYPGDASLDIIPPSNWDTEKPIRYDPTYAKELFARREQLKRQCLVDYIRRTKKKPVR